MGRGGKEGNNAFAYDINEKDEDDYDRLMYIVDRILENEEADPEFLDILELKVPNFSNLFHDRVAIAVRSGNYKIAGHIIKKLFESSGYGYNQLHSEVLNCK